MSLGMLKSYKIFVLILFLFLFVSGCSLYQDIHTVEPELITTPKSDLNVSMLVENNNTIQETIEQNSSIATEADIATAELEVLTAKIPLEIKPEIVAQTEVIVPIVRVSTTSEEKDHKNFGFDLIRKGSRDENTLLVVGGIQGDEPGGFMAASLIATRYKIIKGSVWVIPNLNFYSIIKRSRGPFGDMNRKFASLKESDPDYETISKIKSYIEGDEVRLVVNLHDGSGYYRKTYIDKDHSPHRWGQCSIVDQASLDCDRYGDLESISTKIVEHVNANLIREEDRYASNNTKTAEGNEEMAKTLTYFAIKNKKAAFGNEASKNLPTHERAYYHLLALEKYMEIMGIVFEREFDLTPLAVKEVIDNNIYLSIEGNSISLPLRDIRSVLRYFPVNKDGNIAYVPSNPLLKIIKDKDTYTVYYGNRRLTHLKADYIDFINSEVSVNFKVDNKDTEVKFGEIINVKNDFVVHDHEEYRVNVIGYSNRSKIETDTPISQEKFMKRFSIDRQGQMYRVEFYKEDKFAGTVLIKFEDA